MFDDLVALCVVLYGFDFDVFVLFGGGALVDSVGLAFRDLYGLFGV